LYKETISYPYNYSGYIVSDVYDTLTNDTSWLKIDWNATIPSGSSIIFEVRASNEPFSVDNTTVPWIRIGSNPPVASNLPSGRYIQWKAILSTSNPGRSPVLHDVTVIYRTPIPTARTEIYFNSSCYDIDGPIVNYTWDFGDGSYNYTANTSYLYSSGGIYYVRLYVRDDDGAVSIMERRVEVGG